MFCEKCGTQIESRNITTCPGCGHPVSHMSIPGQQILKNNMQAPQMQDNFNDSEPTLPRMGAQSPNPAPQAPFAQQPNPAPQAPFVQQPGNAYGYTPTPPPAPKKKKSNAGLIAILSVCAGILIGLIILLIVFINNSDMLADIPLFDRFVSSDTVENDEKDDDAEVKKPKEPNPSKDPKPQPPEDPTTPIDNTTVESIINSDCSYTDFGIYVYNRDNGYMYTYNGDKVFLSSAMGQVVILNTLSLAAEEGVADVNNHTIYFDYMPNGKEAPDSKGQDNTYIPVKECVEDVAIYGDNNKSNHIVDYIATVYGAYSGFDVINSTLNKYGYVNTQINRKTFTNSAYIDTSVPPNVTTPSEIGSMFEHLIFDSAFGSETYMKNIFKSISNDGKPIGIRKYVPNTYDVCNVNALTSQCTNNVAVISNGKTEIVVALLSETLEDQTKIDTNDDREKIQQQLIDYIIETQFES